MVCCIVVANINSQSVQCFRFHEQLLSASESATDHQEALSSSSRILRAYQQPQCTMTRWLDVHQSGPKKQNPCFYFAITYANVRLF